MTILIKDITHFLPSHMRVSLVAKDTNCSGSTVAGKQQSHHQCVKGYDQCSKNTLLFPLFRKVSSIEMAPYVHAICICHQKIACT